MFWVNLYAKLTLGVTRMNFYNEIINYDDPTLALKIYDAMLQRSVPYQGKWHFHKELEILVILDGRMELVIQDKIHPLSKGDVFLIGPMEVHLDQNLDVHYIVFQFDVNKFFEPSLAPFVHSMLNPQMLLSKLNYIFQENENVKLEVSNLVTDIYKEYTEQRRGYEVAISIRIKHILLILLRHDSEKVLDKYSSQEVERLKPALQYIAENLAGEISVDECCRMLNITYHYFLKLFKRTMGITFVKYIQLERIKLAERILLTEDLSMEEVAERSGFHNMGYFYKTFHKFNDCTPFVFKKRRN